MPDWLRRFKAQMFHLMRRYFHNQVGESVALLEEMESAQRTS